VKYICTNHSIRDEEEEGRRKRDNEEVKGMCGFISNHFGDQYSIHL